MTDYFVATNGNDSNPGTIGSPFLTGEHAVSVASVGDTIYFRRGVYAGGTWNRTRIAGRMLRAYQGEDVTIDMQGNYPTFTNGQLDGTAAQTGLLSYGFIDLKFVNYTGDLFRPSVGVALGTFAVFRNLFMKALTNVGTRAIASDQYAYGDGDVRIENCTFVGHDVDITTGFPSGIGYLTHNISYGNNTSNFAGLNIYAEKDYNAYPGNGEPHGINTNFTPVGFVSPIDGDYSLSPSSALRRAGRNGSNIGASFNPRVYFDEEYAPFALSSGANDENYYNTTLMQPGPGGPVDAGPAVLSAGRVVIDNVAEPGARSCRWHVGPVTLPAGSVLTLVGWTAEEDETQASGQKKVIGTTAATRSLQVSIDSGPKVEYGAHAAINAPASTVDLYVTLRIDGLTAGGM